MCKIKELLTTYIRPKNKDFLNSKIKTRARNSKTQNKQLMTMKEGKMNLWFISKMFEESYVEFDNSIMVH